MVCWQARLCWLPASCCCCCYKKLCSVLCVSAALMSHCFDVLTPACGHACLLPSCQTAYLFCAMPTLCRVCVSWGYVDQPPLNFISD